MTVSVFVSYSHDDVALVTPIVKLLRLNKALVFQDLDSFELGKRWREQAGRALAEARLVVLFWCVHSSHSNEVESEYKSALKTGKDLLPVPKPAPSVRFHSEIYLFFGLLVVIAIALGVFLWRCRRARVRGEYPRAMTEASDESQRRMAADIEAEILRRSVSAGLGGEVSRE